MLVEAPFKVQLIEKDKLNELHIDFKPSFKEAGVQEQTEQLDSYMKNLATEISRENDDIALQGMQTILQFCESIFPHIREAEVPLDETIVIEIVPENPLTKLLQERGIH